MDEAAAAANAVDAMTFSTVAELGHNNGWECEMNDAAERPVEALEKYHNALPCRKVVVKTLQVEVNWWTNAGSFEVEGIA